MSGNTSGKTDISWMIGGPQGSGVDSSATLFARACSVAGYWVFGKREYHSNIKGKHSYFHVRVKTTPVQSNIDDVHLLATFEDSTAEIHGHEITPDGALLYDPKLTQPMDRGIPETAQMFPIDYDQIIQELADETGKNPLSLTIMKNTVSVAASLALLGIGIEALEEALKGIFTGSKAKLVALNLLAGKKAYEAIAKLDGHDKYAYKLAAPQVPGKGTRMLMNGATAAGLGKIKAGCRIVTYYSITPAVDECIYLEGQSEYGIVVFQSEDELSAVNMAIGAAISGARASTATSGPGFCLMAEGIGWAGISEIPLVVFAYQRGGPSTGLPTRNEQGELLFAINVGHGDFPKIVLAPGDMQECFEDSFYSFNYAERYQTPVIVLPDKALANCTHSIEKFDDTGMEIERGDIVGVDPKLDPNDMEANLALYPRYKITDSGISPRVLPGTAGKIYWMTGDEHTEYGHITEKPEIRLPMHEKRMKKLELAAREIPQDRQYKFFGPQDADLTVVSWGSNKGAILDTMDALQAQGKSINFLHIRLMNPFPTDVVTEILNRAKQVACVENNISGQLAQLIRMRTGIDIPHKVLKWTGRPMSQTELEEAFTEILEKQSRKVVLSRGH